MLQEIRAKELSIAIEPEESLSFETKSEAERDMNEEISMPNRKITNWHVI